MVKKYFHRLRDQHPSGGGEELSYSADKSQLSGIKEEVAYRKVKKVQLPSDLLTHLASSGL